MLNHLFQKAATILSPMIAVTAFSFLVSNTGPANADVKILSRDSWKASKPIVKRDPPIKIVTTGKNRVRAENVMRPSEHPVYLTVHHNQEAVNDSPLPEQLRAHQKSMRKYSITNKENGIKTNIFLGDTPYHYFIDSTGEIAEGRELKFSAYSNTEYLTPITKHVTVVLEGNFDTIEPTKEQLKSLTELLATLAKKYNVELKNIGYHQGVVKSEKDKSGKEAFGTDCPGKNLIKRFGDIKADLMKLGIK